MSRQLASLLAMVAVPFAALHPQHSILIGTVSADSAAKHLLDGATVSIPALKRTVRANAQGIYRIDGLNAGRYLVTVRVIGYQPADDSVTIDDPDANMHDFVVAATAVTLTPVVTKAARVEYRSPRLRGFEDRRHEGFGSFVAEADLRKHDNEQLGNVLQARLPGILVIHKRTGTSISSARASMMNGTCSATVYLDGVLIGQPFNLDDYNVDTLAGVEWYAGVATPPPGYRHGSCGLLLLWTRER